MKRKIFMIAAVLFAGVCAMQAAKPKVIAHRGYWNTAGAAQNSIRSLVKADSIGCYASEFDVWMTPDSVMIVNHDPTINGVVIQNTPAAEVRKEKLSNGETVPTLDEYLETAKGLNTRLVLELKTHDSRAREKAAVKKSVDMIKKYGLADRTDYIVFSKDAFKEFIKVAPKGSKVYFLNGDYTPGQIKFAKGAGIDYSLKVMKKHPEWIKECHDKGLEVNVWTVNEPEDMKWCIVQGVDYITTNEPERLQQMLK
ncbi:MAG: glycerophosphodiester phosphodiesterase [Bacteroidales bacterium]|nr:glycerophosphodiester phosphodiesterase [Bacteroidales bacterium]